jgi:outer membrane protein assembly factor BamB
MPTPAQVQGTGAVNVTTHHGDAQRTGWNANETVLTPTAVAGPAFRQLSTVPLDGQVDAQPLYASGVVIAGSPHNVVYVATENDSLYAIDGDTGTVLLQKSLGTPVSLAKLPGQCNNNSATVGITSTPVIDSATGLLYVIAFTLEHGSPVYSIHALHIDTLQDAIGPQRVGASAKLADQTTYKFNPAVSRQRSALLLANGNVYAAFASFCDNAANVSRGWVLGWRSGTLEPLPAKGLTDRQSTSPNQFFLNSIWMSGAGIAADETGNLFFVTANSDPNASNYNVPMDISESVIKETPAINKVLSYFTPGGPTYGLGDLEAKDEDFGSGGVLLIPEQPGRHPRLAAAAGKTGMMYLLNRDSLGSLGKGNPDLAFGRYNIGGCWCTPSYFQGADGAGRVVSSGGSNVIVWRIETASSNPTLVQESISPSLSSGQDPGFFTTISSNGTAAGSQVVWALGHPINTYPAQILLYAFDPSTVDASGKSTQLFSAVAGYWNSGNANANLVPVVANGKVFVATYKQLAIFGLGSGASVKSATMATPSPIPSIEDTGERLPGHAISGIIRRMSGVYATVQARTGRLVVVEMEAAAAARLAPEVSINGAVLVRGEYDGHGILHARNILRAKDSPALWQADY